MWCAERNPKTALNSQRPHHLPKEGAWSQEEEGASRPSLPLSQGGGRGDQETRRLHCTPPLGPSAAPGPVETEGARADCIPGERLGRGRQRAQGTWAQGSEDHKCLRAAGAAGRAAWQHREGVRRWRPWLQGWAEAGLPPPQGAVVSQCGRAGVWPARCPGEGRPLPPERGSSTDVDRAPEGTAVTAEPASVLWSGVFFGQVSSARVTGQADTTRGQTLAGAHQGA